MTFWPFSHKEEFKWGRDTGTVSMTGVWSWSWPHKSSFILKTKDYMHSFLWNYIAFLWNYMLNWAYSFSYVTNYTVATGWPFIINSYVWPQNHTAALPWILKNVLQISFFRCLRPWILLLLCSVEYLSEKKTGMATKSTHRRHFFVVRHHIVRTITQGSKPGSLDLLTPIPPVWKMEVAHQHWLANILAWFQTYMWCTGMKNRKIFKNLLLTLCDRVIAKTVSCVWHGSKIQSPAVLGMTLLGTGAWSLLYKWFQMCRGAWAELQIAQ